MTKPVVPAYPRNHGSNRTPLRARAAACTRCGRCSTPAEGASIYDVAERFDVNPRTALRYIQALQRAGEPLYEETVGSARSGA